MSSSALQYVITEPECFLLPSPFMSSIIFSVPSYCIISTSVAREPKLIKLIIKWYNPATGAVNLDVLSSYPLPSLNTIVLYCNISPLYVLISNPPLALK